MTLLVSVLGEATFRSRLADNTLRNYREALARWARACVAHASDVSVESVSAHMTARVEQSSPIVANLDLLALLSVLGHLERTGRFEAGLLEAVRRQRVAFERPRQFQAEFLSVEDFNRLCQSVRERPWRRECCSADEALLMAQLVAWSGLRQQEAARLAWADVCWRTRMLLVRSTPGALTKTRRERKVPICEPLLAALKNAPQRGQWVLTHSAGSRRKRGPLKPTAMHERIVSLRGHALMPHVTFVLLRHSRASWWVQAGVPLAKVALWLGHSVETCAMHYAGIRQEYDPDAERMPA